LDIKVKITSIPNPNFPKIKTPFDWPKKINGPVNSMSKVPFKFTQFQHNSTFKGIISPQFNSDDKKKHKNFQLKTIKTETTNNYFQAPIFSLKNEDKSLYIGKEEFLIL
jgi:hypothetical protein